MIFVFTKQNSYYQVASIEPADDTEWSELPPPPELVVSYCGAPGALSPIAEETRHQLSAYENDACELHTFTYLMFSNCTSEKTNQKLQ